MPCHTRGNCSGMTRGTWQRGQGIDWAPKFPRSQSAGRAGTSPILGRPKPQPTGTKGSIANVHVPDTTGQPLEFLGPFVGGSVWQRKRNVQNKKQVVLMLWLNGVCSRHKADTHPCLFTVVEEHTAGVSNPVFLWFSNRLCRQLDHPDN